LRRFIYDHGRHESENPFVSLKWGELLIDGRIDVTDPEQAALERVWRSIPDGV